MSTPIPITEKKRIFTLRDLPELEKIPSKNPHKQLLPSNVVTLSSLQVKSPSLKKTKEKEISKCLSNTGKEIITTDTTNFRDPETILKEGNEALQKLNAKMSELLITDSEFKKKQEEFLKQFNESEKKCKEEFEEIRVNLNTIGERNPLDEQQKEQEFEQFLKRIREGKIEPTNKIEVVDSSVIHSAEAPPDSKTWGAKAWEGIKSAGEWSIKKSIQFFLLIWQWIEMIVSCQYSKSKDK